MALANTQTRYLFFTGKGGVGKTSLSCATGLAMAEAGKKALIVSTDPASNLDEVLGVGLSQAPTAIPGAPGLFALNIDPEAAALPTGNAWSHRIAASCRSPLSRAWKSNSPAPALSRLQPSMNSPSSWATRRRRPNSTMSSSIPHRPVTHYAC